MESETFFCSPRPLHSEKKITDASSNHNKLLSVSNYRNSVTTFINTSTQLVPLKVASTSQTVNQCQVKKWYSVKELSKELSEAH